MFPFRFFLVLDVFFFLECTTNRHTGTIISYFVSKIFISMHKSCKIFHGSNMLNWIQLKSKILNLNHENFHSHFNFFIVVVQIVFCPDAWDDYVFLSLFSFIFCNFYGYHIKAFYFIHHKQKVTRDFFMIYSLFLRFIEFFLFKSRTFGVKSYLFESLALALNNDRMYLHGVSSKIMKSAWSNDWR